MLLKRLVSMELTRFLIAFDFSDASSKPQQGLQYHHDDGTCWWHPVQDGGACPDMPTNDETCSVPDEVGHPPRPPVAQAGLAALWPKREKPSGQPTCPPLVAGQCPAA